MINKMHKEFFFVCWHLLCFSNLALKEEGKEETGWGERQVRKTINLEKNKTAICPSTLRLKSLKKQWAILFSLKKENDKATCYFTFSEVKSTQQL